MWTDIKSDVTLADIVNVRMTGHFVCSSNFTVYAKGLDSSGNSINSGYLGYGQQEFYNGSNQTNNSLITVTTAISGSLDTHPFTQKVNHMVTVFNLLMT